MRVYNKTLYFFSARLVLFPPRVCTVVSIYTISEKYSQNRCVKIQLACIHKIHSSHCTFDIEYVRIRVPAYIVTIICGRHGSFFGSRYRKK